MVDCYCDYELPDAYWASRPVARKVHRCDECAYPIRTGERYERVRAIHDGIPGVWKTCVYCLAIRDMMESRLHCFCWAHGQLLDDVKEALGYGARVPGLAMAVGRVMVDRRRTSRPGV